MEERNAAEPVFVLVTPQMGENIGAAARAMWNFGLSRLRLVAPRDGWPSPEAGATASGARAVLDRVGVFPDTGAALADLSHVFACTARPRELTRPVLTPEAAMAEARALAGRGARVGVLFGPERAGLLSEDVARAQAIVSVPVNPVFPSLNLAQCVGLLAYEWGRQGSPQPALAMSWGGTEAARGAEVDSLAARLERELAATGYFWPEQKAEGMRRNLRAMLARLGLTRSEVQTLHGVVRALVRDKPRGGARGARRG